MSDSENRAEEDSSSLTDPIKIEIIKKKSSTDSFNETIKEKTIIFQFLGTILTLLILLISLYISIKNAEKITETIRLVTTIGNKLNIK